MNLNQLSEIVCDIAIQAGEQVMAIYETADFAVEAKADFSPLTAADLASHQYLVEALAELTPDYPILSEESATIPYEERRHWATYWLIDPLDGTKEFINRNGEFSILIALVHEQKPVLGVVYAPVIDTCWFASLGNGAFKRTGEHTVALQVREAGSCLTVVGSRSHAGDSLKEFLEKAGEYELISMGSILKACLVAEGSADIYPRFGPTSEWDTAAAQIIVEEAGGEMTDTQLLPLKYNAGPTLLNPHFLVYGKSNRQWMTYLS